MPSLNEGFPRRESTSPSVVSNAFDASGTKSEVKPPEMFLRRERPAPAYLLVGSLAARSVLCARSGDSARSWEPDPLLPGLGSWERCAALEVREIPMMSCTSEQ